MTSKEYLWHVRLVKADFYHRTHPGMVVKATTAAEAERIMREITGKNAHDADLDEFLGYEPEAAVIEFAFADGKAAEL